VLLQRQQVLLLESCGLGNGGGLVVRLPLVC